MNILIDGQTLETAEIRRGIGVYFKNVLNNMLKQNFSDIWYITVSDPEAIKSLDEWVASRIVPIIAEEFQPSSDFNKIKLYTNKLKDCVSKYNIEVYWNPNPLMVNVLFPEDYIGCPMFLTIHDIIPAIMPVKEWSSSVRKEYYRRLDAIKNWDRIKLLCVSESTKQDILSYLKKEVPTEVILEAADSKKFYVKREKSSDLTCPKVVFTGGFDYRKNMDGAITAYAKALQLVKEIHPLSKSKLYIVCSADEETKRKFYQKVEKLNITGKVELTGYISDEALTQLYLECDVFFFPSLYEGFGLPILEAMLGGAYILSADNSSLPEVCDKYALFCDAKNVDDMAKKLVIAIENSVSESIDEKQQRQNYALSFSWEKTARKTLDSFENSNSLNVNIVERKKIAIVTPWPLQKTGIANYVFRLLPYLAKYFQVDIFVDDTVVKNVEFKDNAYGKLFKLEELNLLYKNYEEIIYEMGNSREYHSGIYEKMLKYRGIAEIHDFVLHPFFYHAFFLGKKMETYKKALECAYGKEGLDHFQKVKERVMSPDNEKYPMSDSVIKISKATIFHNHWSKEQVEDKKDVYVIPHPCFEPELVPNELEVQRTLIEKIGGKEDDALIIGCFGFVNENKRPYQVVSAVDFLIKKGYKVKLIFWGQNNIRGLKRELEEKYKKNVSISGYLNQDEYACALNMTDIVVNLRYPSMGEASGTLCEAFKYRKPVIVSDVNQYKEFPDEVCWKVPVGYGEQECLREMLAYLIDNAEVRFALGENAGNYADQVLSVEKIAKQYYRVISRITTEV